MVPVSRELAELWSIRGSAATRMAIGVSRLRTADFSFAWRKNILASREIDGRFQCLYPLNVIRCYRGSSAWSSSSLPPVSTVAGPDDGRFLHRGNDRDVLQCTQRPEHEWLWIERRVRSERRVRVERLVRSEPRRPQQHVVRPPLRKRNAGERTVRLTTRGRAPVASRTMKQARFGLTTEDA